MMWGQLLLYAANRILEEKFVAMVRFVIMWERIGVRNDCSNHILEVDLLVFLVMFGDVLWCLVMFGIGVRNDGSNHIVEVDLVVMFVKWVIVMVGVGPIASGLENWLG